LAPVTAGGDRYLDPPETVAEHHARPAGVASPASPATTTAADSVCGVQVAVTAATPQLVVDGEHVFF
jgi:hypothetical protein